MGKLKIGDIATEGKMKFRNPQPSDNEKTEKAARLLIHLIVDNQEEIEPSLWVGAMIAALADVHERSEVPFKLFRESLREAIDHYEY